MSDLYLVEQSGAPRFNDALKDAMDYARANFGTGSTVEFAGARADLDLKNTYWVFSFKITGSKLG